MSRRLADILGPELAVPPGAGELVVSGLALDSRKVKPGDLFAALPGVRTDGRQFIAMAVDNGAACVLAPPGTDAPVPVVEAREPAAALAAIAARFYPRQPAHIAAVTGTNGKSSTVEFLRQIWAGAGLEAAALGTLGVTRSSGRTEVGYTTPDAIALHQALDALAGEGVTHLAMEASSHGLKQHRMDGARISVSAFTNLTQDHLDYHPDFEDYFASKMRLFTALAPSGTSAVVNMDSDWSARVEQTARAAGLEVISIGWRGRDLAVREITPKPASQIIRFAWRGAEQLIELPLIGEFQTANALGAAAMAIASGLEAQSVFAALERLTGVAGRMQPAGMTKDGAPVLLDYAHTPDGLDKLLRAARPHTRGRIILVFGAGGDRDPTKRPAMGAVAARLADVCIVTDDNPRSEDPASIRAAILAACPGATEIGDRESAIRAGIEMLAPGDALLIAGKGHETGQIVGGRVIAFDEPAIVARLLKEREGRS
ncbi:UDP-N-acetylmuramoyl-L-alanyl-D-glutamate--2,6-diaminopimelate ligase [Alkalicaulis satelles]|uniref:UDP-N-acetylmuramoyl-L-alanyl-D-glutamate--2,6-diaminopimelate ligase n=1 Tax=Alkalicaulis satelles TaxID=2609175 RepID=A0A5M6ZN00_9PROT|nr:UDP-N-acetylmuramoyl-L-alanyl-D-glutamate--2,6-diaminopimelate ligase [Alkalicaulis satelles]KAA5805295.1 UDP-N-acetylmuramoyl-L-alanyl-D-glutamate--2,6-diaminopimelate ligase [Alkalicaulis satelles]